MPGFVPDLPNGRVSRRREGADHQGLGVVHERGRHSRSVRLGSLHSSGAAGETAQYQPQVR